MFFLSMALGRKISIIEKKRKDNEILLNEHSKFMTMGQILAGVIHQLRQPIVYIGTLLSNLEALNFKKGGDEEELKVIDKIKSITKSMDKTIFDFYNFYSKDKSKNSFYLNELVSDVIAILSPSISKNGIKVIDRVEKLKVNSYQNSLSHILMIIIENAIDIAKERNIKNPIVEIYSKIQNNKIEIYIKDNCGGIKQKPIESIFEPTISSKEKNSMGIGLTMAKSLIDKKIGGSIEVKNIDNGTEFKIQLTIK